MSSRRKRYSIQWATLAVLLSLGMIGKNAYADPMTTLLSLLFADKVTGQPTDQTVTGKSDTEDANITPVWHKTLSEAELVALNGMQNHPAVGTCMEMADQNHPIAGYNARKIAEFSAFVKLSYAKTGEAPDIESIRYQWPARAFRWCSKKAGITPIGTPRNLEQLARGMMRVVQSIEARHTVVAKNAVKPTTVN